MMMNYIVKYILVCKTLSFNNYFYNITDGWSIPIDTNLSTFLLFTWFSSQFISRFTE